MIPEGISIHVAGFVFNHCEEMGLGSLPDSPTTLQLSDL